MPTHLDAKREAARAFFALLERELTNDEVLSDKQCVRLILEKEAGEAADKGKRFQRDLAFRKLLYGKIDDALTEWCGRREIRADPFMCFRYGGGERGPAQHETALGLAKPAIERTFERLCQEVPELGDQSAVFRSPTKTITPHFRLQRPLPFGAVGEVVYGGDRRELMRSIFRVAMYAATGGDVTRGWHYNCGLLIAYFTERVRSMLGEDLWEAWPNVQARVWEVARVWVILL